VTSHANSLDYQNENSCYGPTGYKIFSRYKDLGYQGLLDRSRRPYRQANQLPFQLESAILRLRTEHPSWGAAKIREKLIRAFPMVPAPAKSTVHAVLDRHGPVERRKRFEEAAPKEARQHPDRSIEVGLQAADRRTAAYSHISWPADGSTFEQHQWT
jgi:hypothetical protein